MAFCPANFFRKAPPMVQPSPTTWVLPWHPRHPRQRRRGSRLHVAVQTKITLLIRFIQQGNRVAHVTSRREILYGSLNSVIKLKCLMNIFGILTFQKDHFPSLGSTCLLSEPLAPLGSLRQGFFSIPKSPRICIDLRECPFGVCGNKLTRSPPPPPWCGNATARCDRELEFLYVVRI